MDIDDLKSEVRAASMSVDDLAARVSAAEPAEARELEIDLNLTEQELEELEKKADRLKADLEDAADQAGLEALEEELETLAQAREALRGVEQELADVPELSDLDDGLAAADSPEIPESSPELGR